MTTISSLSRAAKQATTADAKHAVLREAEEGMKEKGVKHEAGVWEQGRGFVSWSSHGTEERAESAARRYARGRQSPTGGALPWAGGVRGPEGVRWMDGQGRPAPSGIAEGDS